MRLAVVVAFANGLILAAGCEKESGDGTTDASASAAEGADAGADRCESTLEDGAVFTCPNTHGQPTCAHPDGCKFCSCDPDLGGIKCRSIGPCDPDALPVDPDV
jgi:hypothetical protein